MDVGSAVLSAEVALEFIDDDLRKRTVVSRSLVEGLIAAAVSGCRWRIDRWWSLRRVMRWLVASQIAAAADTQPRQCPGAWGDSRQLRCGLPHGLHMRPAARLVTAATAPDTHVLIRNRTAGSAWVTASSLSKVSGLDIRYGDKVELRAIGLEAADVVGDLLALAANNFGVEREDEGPHGSPGSEAVQEQ